MLGHVGARDRVVLLDERGHEASSEDVAALIAAAGDDGVPLTFCIGGPFGHGSAVVERADTSLRLSRRDLPGSGRGEAERTLGIASPGGMRETASPISLGLMDPAPLQARAEPQRGVGRAPGAAVPRVSSGGRGWAHWLGAVGPWQQDDWMVVAARALANRPAHASAAGTRSWRARRTTTSVKLLLYMRDMTLHVEMLLKRCSNGRGSWTPAVVNQACVM